MASVDDDRGFLNSLSEHPDRPGDTSNMNPEFATRLAAAIRQANAAGLHLGVMSGYRSDTTTGSAYDAGGNSAHGYGLASDISGLDGPNGKITQQWAAIAKANGLNNPYGVGNKAEFNHWQLPAQPLEKTPGLLKQLQTARATGDWNNVWTAYNGSPVAGTQFAGPGVPGTKINASSAPVAGALAAQPAKSNSPYGNSFVDALATIESNNRNIPSGVDKDYSGQPGSKSQGFFQIDTPTWQQFAAKAGVDTTKYPNAMSAPPAVQAQVVQTIPLSRFGARTQKMLNQQFGGNLDASLTIGDHAAKVGAATQVATAAPGAAAPTTGAAPAAAPADQSWVSQAWSKLTGSPVDKDGNPTGTASPLQQLSQASVARLGAEGQTEKQETPEKSALNMQAPGARNVSPGLANVAQVYGQTLNSFSQPLTWTSKAAGPPGMPPAGLQQARAPTTPGLSLTSLPVDPNGLGYGVDPNLGYGYG